MELQTEDASTTFCWTHSTQNTCNSTNSDVLSYPMQKAVYSVAFCPTRALVASGSKDQSIRLWHVSA